MTCPQTLVAGDSLNFLTTVTGYPASGGWALKYRLIPRTAGGTAIVLTSVAEGDDYRTQAAKTTTANWVADNYTWTSWVEKGSERYTLTSGQIVITPNPENAAAGYDGRSMAQRALDDARAAYAAFQASKGQTRRYRIADREMEFTTAGDIIKQIRFWEFEVKREENCAKSALGQDTSGKFYIRHLR